MEKNTFKTFNVTDEVIEFIIQKYDEIGLDPDKGYDRILIAFHEIEQRGILALFDRMYKKFPYTAMSKTEKCVDSERTKIKRIVYKS